MRIDVTEGPDAGMAWHFGSPLIEQRQMCQGDGVVQLTSREVFTIGGADRLDWLHTMTTQEFREPRDGEAFILDPNGRIQHGFNYIVANDHLWCWTEPGARQPLLAWLESMKFWSDIQSDPRDDVDLWWVGNNVTVDAIAVRDSEIASGREVIVPKDHAAHGGTEAGQWAYEALRIEAGIPRVSIDTDIKTIPNEIGLRGTALDKGCYPGQETVARVHNLGRPPRRLVRLLFDGAIPENSRDIIVADKTVGTLTSVANQYLLGPIGLALVKRNVDVDATVTVDGIAASQEALVDPDIGIHFRPTL